MRYGYLEDCNDGISGLFTRVVTPPLLSKIGLSANHPKFVFIGFKKSILRWLNGHQDIVVEVKNPSQRHVRRDVTFEISSVYNFPFSPCRILVRSSKNQDYTEPVPGSPEYYDNTRIVVIESGRKIKDILPFIDRCWASSTKSRYIVNTEVLNAVAQLGSRGDVQPSQYGNGVVAQLPFGPSPTYRTVEYGIPLDQAPTYKTIDSVRSAINSLPRYSSIDQDRLLIRAGVPQDRL
ncbi:hypothetical protein K493DRAFT_390921 [Basidiobolus meristosporus CBS 931.73]|uniref:Uncharacterized protein n=1 Tax=Basidiobolus meristosporus CBS 931.73 TaxID=1314790 RepID=A0A1Y1X0W7_9FUNG|nr:hypothetical protein K493DRAFT_390921 [Basidiobolus meristosporus CBS 931.73]|eukprot:ORX79248.1 hypothetical protein K493DRAFT_390921 [Basidiobolus meristosporus CBS 931.73]